MRDGDFGPPGRGNDEIDDTTFGLNLLFGVGFRTDGPWRPYVQAKALLGDHDELVLAVGVRF